MRNDARAERQSISVSSPPDVYAARNAARMLAQTIGFNSAASEEIVLAVSELASNLLKHAIGGTINLIPLFDAERTGIQVESHDHGPGIQDLPIALADGSSTTGSLGYGLGSVNRIMDEFDITSKREPPDNGTHILCKRFLRFPNPASSPGPLAFGVASRAHPLMNVNGDSFVIKQWGTSALVGLIDGLGHGQHAQSAAQAARQYVESHYDQPLASVFLGTGRASHATRGVVMALARFDWTLTPLAVKFSFCSIGDIEIRMIGKSEPMNFVVRRGVLGGNAPTPVVTNHRWQENYVMVLHSDGVSSHWNWTDFPELAKASAEVTAQRLLHDHASDSDDATVLVVRSAHKDRPREGAR